MRIFAFIKNAYIRWQISREERRAHRKFIQEKFEDFLNETKPEVPKAPKYPEAALYRHAWKRAAALSVISKRAGLDKMSEYYSQFAHLAAAKYSHVAPSGPYGPVKLNLSYSAFLKLAESEVDRITKVNLDTVGVVYLLKMDVYYKIGFTNDINRRIGELRIQMPKSVELIHYIKTDECEKTEKYWHEYFKDKRLRGEWFLLTDEEVSEFRKYTNMN